MMNDYWKTVNDLPVQEIQSFLAQKIDQGTVLDAFFQELFLNMQSHALDPAISSASDRFMDFILFLYDRYEYKRSALQKIKQSVLMCPLLLKDVTEKTYPLLHFVQVKYQLKSVSFDHPLCSITLPTPISQLAFLGLWGYLFSLFLTCETEEKFMDDAQKTLTLFVFDKG